jgi:FkbM family methyltransferase
MDFLYRVARSVARTVGSDSAAGRAARPVVERLIRWSAGKNGLAWDINGVPCRIDPRFRAQLARTYDAELARYLRARVRPGQTCLDVGANIGAWVIQFAHLVGPTGRVIAFEPNPAARAVLEDHVRLNHLGGIARIVPAAVGAGPGEVPFYAAGSDGMSRVGAPNPLVADRAVPLTVPVVTLDDWCRAENVAPDWLFIDVEGFEGHALAGAVEVVRSRGAGLGIVIEMHPSLWPASGTTREEVAARIAALGRRAVPLTGQADPLGEYGHVSLEPV